MLECWLLTICFKDVIKFPSALAALFDPIFTWHFLLISSGQIEWYSNLHSNFVLVPLTCVAWGHSSMLRLSSKMHLPITSWTTRIAFMSLLLQRNQLSFLKLMQVLAACATELRIRKISLAATFFIIFDSLAESCWCCHLCVAWFQWDSICGHVLEGVLALST